MANGGSLARTDFKSVDEYIASQPDAVQTVLRRLRSAMRKALPRAEEVISYQIPAYRLHGSTVLHFAGWKKHYSIYPATDGLVAAFKNDLAPYEVNDKGTIRFPLSEPVPVSLLVRLAKFRATEAEEQAKKKAKKKTASAKKTKTKTKTKRARR